MQAGSSSRSRERDWQTDREMTNEKKKEGRKNNSITEYVLELLQQLHRGTKGVLMAHPDVNLCAVVAKSDEKWGEVPCAFVELKKGATADEQGLIAFCRQHLAGFKTPKRVVFQELPKTSTGKIQKFELRTIAKDL